MLPNIVFAIKHKEGFENLYKNKIAEICEQIGRYSCMCFMIFNIPFTYLNFWFAKALIVYLAINGILCLAYLIFWVVFWNKNGLAKALSLSVTPSLIFVFSGIMLANFPLIAFSIIFSVTHILISTKNAIHKNKKQRGNL